MSHKAIYTLYPNVVSIVGDSDAFDSEGNKVEIDMGTVNAWVDPDAYKRLRARAYPPIGDQLDALWKGGDAAAEMLARVQAVKTEYPKP